MPSVNPVRIGIVGSRFQADCIAASVRAVPDEAEVVAVASPTPGNAADFARRHGVPAAYADWRELLRDPAVELVSITAPNDLHAPIAIAAAARVCESGWRSACRSGSAAGPSWIRPIAPTTAARTSRSGWVRSGTSSPTPSGRRSRPSSAAPWRTSCVYGLDSSGVTSGYTPGIPPSTS